MLDLYNSMSTEEKSDVDQYRSLFTTTRPALASHHDTEFLHDADMVMSFVNLGKMNFYISYFTLVSILLEMMRKDTGRTTNPIRFCAANDIFTD